MTPVDPPKNTIGRKTAESTIAMPISAIWIWPIDSIVAWRGVISGFSCISRSTFSTTTIASSTSRPVARTKPKRIMVLIEIQRVEDREGPEQHDGHGDERDQSRPPALQEDENDEDDQDDRLHQSFHDLDHRQLDEVAGIVGVGVVVPGRHPRRDIGDLRLDQVGGKQRVGSGLETDADAGARMAVGADSRRIIVGAEFDAGHIAEQHASTARISLDDDVAELFGGLEPRLGGHRSI